VYGEQAVTRERRDLVCDPWHEGTPWWQLLESGEVSVAEVRPEHVSDPLGIEEAPHRRSLHDEVRGCGLPTPNVPLIQRITRST
jgi:hypothetical protein